MPLDPMDVRRQREQHSVGGDGLLLADDRLELDDTLLLWCNGAIIGRACAAAVCNCNSLEASIASEEL